MNYLKFAFFSAAFFMTNAQADQGLDEAISRLQHEWAIVNYQTPEDRKESAFETLVGMAHDVSLRYPDRAEPLVWEAIVLASEAKVKGGFSALGLAKDARKLLLSAERINPGALDGSIYTTLGSLYYKVPGWPIGFGDHKKAREYLDKALKLNPNGMDPNYFYGDLMLGDGNYDAAITYLRKALAAPPRVGREVADAGRRTEIQADLKKAEESR
ncbi:MAG TPA: tetratricopeptide repeat protein [Burkholderiales bacterium]|nr:tetratricopeptide repeat protein [Burkholderiales bacterium]